MSSTPTQKFHPALRNGEPICLTAPDGFVLRGELLHPQGSPKVAVVLSHAMMVDRRTLDKPAGDGLLTTLINHGAAVLWMDLRGHGQSRPRASEGGAWDYDALVKDVTLLASFLAETFPQLARVTVGHSLFGHVALAYQASIAELESTPFTKERPPFHRMALLGSSFWMRRLEPNLWRWLLKVTCSKLTRNPTHWYGRFPARLLKIGSNDEALGFLDQMDSWVRTNDWTDIECNSYWEKLDRVNTPILSIAGQGDSLLSAPENQRRLLTQTSGEVTHRIIGRSTQYDFNPGHMDLVLHREMKPVWEDIARWVIDPASK